MKRLTLIAILLMSFAGSMVGQQIAEGLKIGPNQVRVEARHCQAYISHPRWFGRHFLGHHTQLTSHGSDLCQADSSTVFYFELTHNIKTNAGVDFVDAQVSGTASTSTAQWIGLSTSVTAVSATDTSLPSEITANGLGRAQATYAHTVGSTTYTLTELFTATGSQSGIAKVGVLTANFPGGTLVYEVLLGTPGSLNSGDQLSAQWTVTTS